MHKGSKSYIPPKKFFRKKINSNFATEFEKYARLKTEVTPEATFTNDLGADSLDTVELIMELEKEFNITIPDDQAEKITTVGDAISYVEANAK